MTSSSDTDRNIQTDFRLVGFKGELAASALSVSSIVQIEFNERENKVRPFSEGTTTSSSPQASAVSIIEWLKLD